MLQGKESNEQIFLFEWAAYNTQRFPELALMFHVPNGGKRNAREAASLKRQGVKAGVPDLVLPVPRGEYHGAYIELKVNKNKTTDKQNKWIEQLKKQGYFVAVCYGWQKASEAIENYLMQPKLDNIEETILKEYASDLFEEFQQVQRFEGKITLKDVVDILQITG